MTYSDYYKPIHDKHVIGVNNQYQLGDWVDFCFFGDCSWWQAHLKLLRDFKGVLVSTCHRFENARTREWTRVKYLQKTAKKLGLTTNKAHIVWNHNSGAAAVNLAVLLGAAKIVLLGFDMKMGEIRENKQTRPVSHNHGCHYEKFPNDPKGQKKIPPFDRHLQGFPVIKKAADEIGVQIFNCNPDSAIKCFPVIGLEEALRL